MRRLSWTHDAWRDYTWWESQDRKTLKRINALIEDVMRSPFEGIGKPEPLRGDLAGMWSRRISQADRLVYEVFDGEVVIYSCKDHY